MRKTLLAGVFVAAAALLTACTGSPGPASTPTPTTNGVDALEADQIIDRAVQALEDADSYHVAGKGEDEGETIELDVVFAGDDKKGTITAGGITFDLLVVDGKAYFKGGEDLWTQFIPEEELDTVLPLLSGKWVALPAGQGFDLEPSDLLEPSGTVTKGDITTENGKKVITLIDSDGGKLFISLEGEPYPVKMVDDDGTIEFTDINADVTIEAPAAADVFDLSSFAG